jgi:1-phosphofructokinase
MVLAPAPLLTVTIEPSDEIHVHAGGQGFWIARMMSVLGSHVRFVATFGGEPGAVALGLAENAGLDVRAVRTEAHNGAYIHDRRSGERVPIAEMAAAALTRHEVDELYGAALTEGIDSDVCVLSGLLDRDVLPDDFFRRLASDLRANDKCVVADLSGSQMDAALHAGLDVLKTSDEDLARDGLSGDLVQVVRDLSERGARTVVVTREREPTLALHDGRLLRVAPPRVETVEPRGAGDSFTAGLAHGLASGVPMEEALMLATAAGALNVTRRGLGSGGREEIERLAGHISVEAA